MQQGKKGICMMYQDVYSGPCFSLSACRHFFHGDCVRTVFNHFCTDDHVTCPSVRETHVTNCAQGQAQLLVDSQQINVAARKCESLMRQSLARKHFTELR